MEYIYLPQFIFFHSLDIQPPSFSGPCPHQVTVAAEPGTLEAQAHFEEPVPTDNSGHVNITRYWLFSFIGIGCLRFVPFILFWHQLFNPYVVSCINGIINKYIYIILCITGLSSYNIASGILRHSQIIQDEMEWQVKLISTCCSGCFC